MFWHLSDLATWQTQRAYSDTRITSTSWVLFSHSYQSTLPSLAANSLQHFWCHFLTGVKMNQLHFYCLKLLDNTMPHHTLCISDCYQFMFSTLPLLQVLKIMFWHLSDVTSWLSQRHMFWCKLHFCILPEHFLHPYHSALSSLAANSLQHFWYHFLIWQVSRWTIYTFTALSYWIIQCLMIH